MNVFKLIDRIRRCAVRDILEEIEELLDKWEPGKRHHAHHLRFKFGWRDVTIQGDHMTFSMPSLNASGQHSTVTVIGSPVQADGVTPSQATLSTQTYVSSDETIFTVAADPSVPGGAIITALAQPDTGVSVSATLTETALATELDGTTTETIQGLATIIINGPPVVIPPAAALVFTFGTPQ